MSHNGATRHVCFLDQLVLDCGHCKTKHFYLRYCGYLKRVRIDNTLTYANIPTTGTKLSSPVAVYRCDADGRRFSIQLLLLLLQTQSEGVAVES